MTIEEGEQEAGKSTRDALTFSADGKTLVKCDEE